MTRTLGLACLLNLLPSAKVKLEVLAPRAPFSQGSVGSGEQEGEDEALSALNGVRILARLLSVGVAKSGRGHGHHPSGSRPQVHSNSRPGTTATATATDKTTRSAFAAFFASSSSSSSSTRPAVPHTVTAGAHDAGAGADADASPDCCLLAAKCLALLTSGKAQQVAEAVAQVRGVWLEQ